MTHDWAKYIGIPFRDHGRDFSGCDCYGLVRLALQEEFGVVLPALYDGYDDALNHEEVGAAIAHWRPLLLAQRLRDPEEAAVAVIVTHGWPSHVGLCIDNRLILHTRSSITGSVMHRVDDPFFRGRIEGFYRVR